MTTSPTASPLPVIGWREWIGMPELGIVAIKAKIDTGARSSSLHAFDVETYLRRGQTFVRFNVHPIQRDSDSIIATEAALLEYRHIRSSSGHQQLRPVILTSIELLGRKWEVELTLAGRDEMGFRMLLGRQALRDQFLVDPGRSFLGGRPRRKRARRALRKPKRSEE